MAQQQREIAEDNRGTEPPPPARGMGGESQPVEVGQPVEAGQPSTALSGTSGTRATG